MSAYENVICGKLKLKGKALDVKSGGIFKSKKSKLKKKYDYHNSLSKDSDTSVELQNPLEDKKSGDELALDSKDNRLTPAERQYLCQWENINRQRLEKMANKSHRDRIQEFNRYLANLTEHYDIPKVGPG